MFNLLPTGWFISSYHGEPSPEFTAHTPYLLGVAKTNPGEKSFESMANSFYNIL